MPYIILRSIENQKNMAENLFDILILGCSKCFAECMPKGSRSQRVTSSYLHENLKIYKKMFCRKVAQGETAAIIRIFNLSCVAVKRQMAAAKYHNAELCLCRQPTASELELTAKC